jgi:hypothetical protein
MAEVSNNTQKSNRFCKVVGLCWIVHCRAFAAHSQILHISVYHQLRRMVRVFADLICTVVIRHADTPRKMGLLNIIATFQPHAIVAQFST